MSYNQNIRKNAKPPNTPGVNDFSGEVAPVNAIGEVEDGIEPVPVATDANVKLAQVNRVVFELWMTIDLSPKKYGDPGVVER